MNHSFDIDHAALYGIPEAVLISNFQHWITKNRANGTHFHDGRTWTYNTVKAFAELFPYLSIKQVRRALGHLIDEAVLLKGDYNKIPTNHTLWYAFADESKFLQGQTELPKRANRIAPEGNSCFAQKGKSTNRTDITTDSKHTDTAPAASSTSLAIVESPVLNPVDQVFFHWQQVMQCPRAKLDTKRRTAVQARLKDGYTAADLMQAIDGCRASDWHMGKNKDGKVFNDLELICRDAGKVDGFMAQTNRAPQAGSAGESLQEKNARIMAQVMRGGPDSDLRTIDMEA